MPATPDSAAFVDSFAFARQQIVAQYEVALDAEVWFGADSKQWTHEERCRRLAEAFDALWRDKGGVGGHPLSALYRRAAS